MVCSVAKASSSGLPDAGPVAVCDVVEKVGSSPSTIEGLKKGCQGLTPVSKASQVLSQKAAQSGGLQGC